MIPDELRPPIGNRIYGCDDCLAVCPWNKFAQPAREPDFLPRAALTAPRWPTSPRSTMPASARCFAGTPVKRIGRDRFLRNVLIAIGNAGRSDPGLVAAARHASTTRQRWSAPPRSGPLPAWHPDPTRPSAPAGSPASRIHSSARSGSAIQPGFE